MTRPRPIHRAQRPIVNNSTARPFPPDPLSLRARPWSPAGGRELALTARPPAGFSLLLTPNTIKQKNRAKSNTLLAQRNPLPGNSYFWRTAMIGEMGSPGAGDKSQTFVYFGDGKGGFKETVVSVGQGIHEGKLGDFNGDGRLDILMKPYHHNAPRLDVLLNFPGDKSRK